jgi:hypothetical protein
MRTRPGVHEPRGQTIGVLQMLIPGYDLMPVGIAKQSSPRTVSK